MKLVNGILRPGKVIEVLENGRIRADVPGLFSSRDKELLPPIMPFPIGPANSFSQPKEWQEVWVLNFTDNPLQLYWFRKDNFEENDKEILTEENVEVLCNRESGMGWATIYFSDGSGWIIRNDESTIQIRSNGSIVMKMDWPHRTIDINSQCISIGSEGESAHPAAYADKTQEVFNTILGILKSIATVTQPNPYTMMISTVINAQINQLSDKIGTISSPHVKID